MERPRRVLGPEPKRRRGDWRYICRPLDAWQCGVIVLVVAESDELDWLRYVLNLEPQASSRPVDVGPVPRDSIFISFELASLLVAFVLFFGSCPAISCYPKRFAFWLISRDVLSKPSVVFLPELRLRAFPHLGCHGSLDTAPHDGRPAPYSNPA